MYPYIYLVIPSYALLAFVGGIVAICYVYHNIDKENVLFTELLRAIIYGGIGLFLGSKLLFAVTQIPWLINNFNVKNMLFLIPRSGYVFYGGLFGFIFAICFMCKDNLDYKKRMFNLFVPAFPLFHVFGRIGCFMAGCCYGRDLTEPFIILNMKINRIPVQLFEAGMDVIIFIVLCLIKKKKAANNLLAIYLITYGIIRFCLEFLRGDEVRGLYAGLSTSQYISLMILIYYSVSKILSLVAKKRENNVVK